MTWLGLDIGGANLKAANATGWTSSRPFPLWRDPHGLAGRLAAIIADAPAAEGIAVTMTGELCDSFRTKEEGVEHILAAVQQVSGVRDVSVFLVDGRFVSIPAARESFRLAAASNWRALAEFVCRFIPQGAGVLIDVGSTTSDIIPIVDGRVAAHGTNDIERLAARELVYSGVGRTPICALTSTLPWRGAACPVAAEVFATSADAYLLLGEFAEDPQANWTADARPLTSEFARQRLARQICADSIDLTPDDFLRMAQTVCDAQLRQLTGGLSAVAGRMPTAPELAIVSGGGEFLARKAAESVLAGSKSTSLASQLGTGVSHCAPAFAVAVLAAEWADKAGPKRE
jgi:probable H4MPT-linked C1 transfer pathway protein